MAQSNFPGTGVYSIVPTEPRQMICRYQTASAQNLFRRLRQDQQRPGKQRPRYRHNDSHTQRYINRGEKRLNHFFFLFCPIILGHHHRHNRWSADDQGKNQVHAHAGHADRRQALSPRNVPRSRNPQNYKSSGKSTTKEPAWQILKSAAQFSLSSYPQLRLFSFRILPPVCSVLLLPPKI